MKNPFLPLLVIGDIVWLSSLFAAENGVWPPLQNPISLAGSGIKDLRLFHSGPDELKERIAKKVCLLDPRGIAATKKNHDIRMQEIVCTNETILGPLLDRLQIDPYDLGGCQLRIFKQNEISQTSDVSRRRGMEELPRLRSIKIEPGDVIVVCVQREW